MVTNLRQVFDRLKAAGLKLKPNKCSLFSNQVTFLGHVISSNGVATDPCKMQNVKDWPVAANVSEQHSFLGLCGYYRRYIKNFSAIAKCLHKLIEKGRKYLWDDNCQDISVTPIFRTSRLQNTDASRCYWHCFISRNRWCWDSYCVCKLDTNQDRMQILCHPQGAISSCAFCKALPPFSLWKNVYSSNWPQLFTMVNEL